MSSRGEVHRDFELKLNRGVLSSMERGELNFEPIGDLFREIREIGNRLTRLEASFQNFSELREEGLKHLRGELSSLEKKIDRLERLLVGNEREGLSSRVERLENTLKSWRRLAIPVWVAILAVVGQLIARILENFHLVLK